MGLVTTGMNLKFLEQHILLLMSVSCRFSNIMYSVDWVMSFKTLGICMCSWTLGKVSQNSSGIIGQEFDGEISEWEPLAGLTLFQYYETVY
jgi:hypothetical protein